MNRKTLVRLLLVVTFALLGLAGVLSHPARANDCVDCRSACLADYQNCFSSGLDGCDDVYVECVSGCPCP